MSVRSSASVELLEPICPNNDERLFNFCKDSFVIFVSLWSHRHFNWSCFAAKVREFQIERICEMEMIWI